MSEGRRFKARGFCGGYIENRHSDDQTRGSSSICNLHLDTAVPPALRLHVFQDSAFPLRESNGQNVARSGSSPD